MLSYILFAIGLYLLMLGGNWLVKGAVAVAERLGIAPLIIGLTIVAFGTSAPELVISLNAALTGSGGLAVGNVVGSNIANVLLVLGAPALIAVISCQDKGLKTSLVFLMGITAIFTFQLMSGNLGRLDGTLLLICLAAFLFQQYISARRQHAEELDNYRDEIGHVPQRTWRVAMFLALGLITLPIAAHLTVSSAVDIAVQWQVPEEIIGLTVIAIGTSLPELATGISAARFGNASVAVGNVIGSNIFNIAAIMGITAFVTNVPVGGHVVEFDVWVMIGTTMLLILLPLAKLRIGKILGSVMLVGYAAYLAFTFGL